MNGKTSLHDWAQTVLTIDREIMALLGRPCVIQAREVDIMPFSLETSSVDLQYLERMVSI